MTAAARLDKLVDKLEDRNRWKTITWQEFCTIARNFNIRAIRSSGSHYVFEHQEYSDIKFTAVRPHDNNNIVKAPYLERLSLALDTLNDREKVISRNLSHDKNKNHTKEKNTDRER